MKKKNKTNASLKIFYVIFLILGIGFCIASIFFIKSGKEFMDKAVEITGTISLIEIDHDSDGDTTHNVYVNYEYNGVKYENKSVSTYTASMDEGDEIKLYCDPDNPEKVDNSYGEITPGIIMAIMGIGFMLFGILPLIGDHKKNSLKKRLLQEGQKIFAIVYDVSQNTSLEVNGRNPAVVTCRYEDMNTGELKEYKSNNIWDDSVYSLIVGETNIPVYIDRQDSSKYYVDVDSVLGD